MFNNHNCLQNDVAALFAHSLITPMTTFTDARYSFGTTTLTQNDSANNTAYAGIQHERPLPVKISVKLEDANLWKRFHTVGTEMILTKNGRRLFPNFCVRVHKLEPNTKYVFILDIAPIDDNRYKFQNPSWVVAGKGEPHTYGRYYIHPDSPQTGTQWMKQPILFNKVKITNNPMHQSDQILLHSLHRYVPRLHIAQASDNCSITTQPTSIFSFDETTFMAVTAYQNDQVKCLKIDNNPFAKGFRELIRGKKKNSKPVKRLQSNSTSHQTKNSDGQDHCVNENDTASLPSTSCSPVQSSHTSAISIERINGNIDESEQRRSMTNSYFQIPSPSQFQSTMFCNPSYAQIGLTPEIPMHFPSYGYYPAEMYSTNYYNTSVYY